MSTSKQLKAQCSIGFGMMTTRNDIILMNSWTVLTISNWVSWIILQFHLAWFIHQLICWRWCSTENETTLQNYGSNQGSFTNLGFASTLSFCLSIRARKIALQIKETTSRTANTAIAITLESVLLSLLSVFRCGETIKQ